MSMQILQKANAYNVRCSVLTKGILPAELATLPLQNEYGITVVSLDESFAHQYEPGAAPIQDRISALRFLSENGCRTWVSVEPYPTPNMMNQNLSDILEAVSFTNKIIFGRLHYNKIVSEYPEYKQFYNECAEQVIAFCEERSISYHIKTGTLSKEEE